jgi:hypothetical protein
MKQMQSSRTYELASLLVTVASFPAVALPEMPCAGGWHAGSDSHCRSHGGCANLSAYSEKWFFYLCRVMSRSLLNYDPGSPLSDDDIYEGPRQQA